MNKIIILLSLIVILSIPSQAETADQETIEATITNIQNSKSTVKNFGIKVGDDQYDYIFMCWNGGQVKLKFSEIDRIIFLNPGNRSIDSCSFNTYQVDVRLKDGSSEKMRLNPSIYREGKNDGWQRGIFIGESKFGKWTCQVHKVKIIEFKNKIQRTSEYGNQIFPDDYIFNPYTGKRLN